MVTNLLMFRIQFPLEEWGPMRNVPHLMALERHRAHFSAALICRDPMVISESPANSMWPSPNEGEMPERFDQETAPVDRKYLSGSDNAGKQK
jgi:hypothetical protein